jgi:hypothetical protein
MRANRIGRAVLTMATAALVAGCYSPKLSNYGFACDSQAPKPCPDGYFCHNGFCDDGSGGAPPATGGNGADDMAMSQGGGGGGGGSAGGGGGGGGAEDMAMSVQDMAMPPADMAKPPADMVVVSTCKHDECTTGAALTKSCSACANAVCTKDSLCCNTTNGWDTICVGEVNKYCTGIKTCP